MKTFLLLIISSVVTAGVLPSLPAKIVLSAIVLMAALTQAARRAPVGYQDEKTDVDVTLTLADNKLQGTQTLPLSFLGNDKQAYTFPDENVNRLEFLAAKGSRFLAEDVLLGGNTYYRRYRASGFASNVNDGFGSPDESNEAFNDQSTIDQKTWGLGVQLTLEGEVASMKHQFVAGVSGDFGDTRFGQQEQAARFTPERGTDPTGPFTTINDVALRNAYTGIYVSDTIALAARWTLTVAGRWNRAHVEIEDRSGLDEALNGSHTFTRFNPAVGLNFNPTETLTAYASYNEGMRAPTPIELTCADPTAPCRLPNEFLSDPPLAKVVSKTMELGARGRIAQATTWSAAVYRTDLDDDIEFTSSGGAVNAGFFRNVGKTRRQGVELAATTHHGPVAVDLRYNHIDATFRSTFSAFAPNNSSADDNGAITVNPGNRIPGIPADSFKMRVEYERGPFQIGAGLIAASSQYAHGDENNSDINGNVPGYAVVNLDARYEVTRQLAIFALVFLVVIHKLEYFLNSKIIGDRIRNPVWLTLIALIIGERLMGIPGLILAPVVLNYLRVEMLTVEVRPLLEKVELVESPARESFRS